MGRKTLLLGLMLSTAGCVSQIGVMVRDVSVIEGRVQVERCRLEFVSGGLAGDSVRIVEESCTQRWADESAVSR